jgi:hypothetical protein
MKMQHLHKIVRNLPVLVFLFFLGTFFQAKPTYADIWEPEGLNMPGAWNGWSNPPTNLALASYTQVPGGRVTKISTGTPRWQTILAVKASGGDLTAGTYQWLFTSGSTSNPWGNKWGGVTVTMNSLQSYTYSTGAANNSITLLNDKYYTMNWKDSGYAGTQAIYMVTSAQPVLISSVTVPASATPSTPVNVAITISAAKSAEEIIYVRYTIDNWATSSVVTATMTGTTGTATIPGQSSGTIIQCYAFSSTVTGITSDYDMYSIKLNNNGGANYSCTVGAPPITWANLQNPPSATINPGSSVNVYAQVFISGTTGQSTPAPGVLGWIGYNTVNDNPSGWNNWVPATFSGPSGSNDEYVAAIGSSLSPGTYYYASRFQLNSGNYVYGGYNGGYWNGTTNVSGVLTVSGAPPAVTTGSVSNIAATTASVSGTVVGDGGDPNPVRGVCWNTSPNPTIADNISSAGSGLGSFTANLTGLTPGTTYYAKAYATNTYGTGYGAEVTFSTLFAVTFNVDMVTAAGFVPGVDSIFLAGSFPGATWNQPGTNATMKLSQVGSSLIYTNTLYLPSGTYEFKHFKNAGWSGGEWSGGSNRSVTVSSSLTLNNTWGGEINWANLQSPASGTILPSTILDVYAQAYIPNGITGVTGGAYGLQCWIGYSTSNTDPSTWTNWISAPYFGAAGSNDEFKGDLGSVISSAGTYYYASRFQFGNGAYYYGGYNSGFWNGTTNISGVLSVVNGFVLTVNTGAVSAVTATSADVAGDVIADGGKEVTERGICWGLSPDPSLSDQFTVNGGGLGTFVGTLTPLLPGTVYHARAYATNANGTAYGLDVQFTTHYLVTFNVDMTSCQGFIPGIDSVYIAGGFPGGVWNEPGTNPVFKLSHSSGMIYTLTLALPAGTYEFKHFRNAGWGGGEWTGGSNRSVVVSSNTTFNHLWGGDINWANLQWPDAGSIGLGGSYEVYAQAYIPNGITGNAGGAYSLQAWIGYSTDNTDPSTWTNWVEATYLGAAGSNDEFKADLGTAITSTGVYYYASRFKFGGGTYYYGGYNGGFWDGTTNISGVLTVNAGNKALNLTLLLEGLASDRGLGAPPAGTMFEAYDENGIKWGPGIADVVTIELRDAALGSLIYSVNDVQVSTSGSLSAVVPSIHNGDYYIYVRHRNSITTSTANFVSFSGSTITYDFTTSASQAFGDNMKVVGGYAHVYAGDENVDGLVDSTDLNDCDNDSAAFAAGYLGTDVNGDGLVDSSDLNLIDNNNAAFVASVLPF